MNLWSSVETRIRERVRDGRLPRQDATGTWAALRGTNARCAGCDEPVSYDQIEYELLFEDGARVTLHLACMRFWAHLKEAMSPTSQGT